MARAETYEPETPMTRENFLAWADQQPIGRFERIDGIVVRMSPERISHTRCKGAAWRALRRAAKAAGLPRCETFMAGMFVEVDDSDFVPDAVLRYGPRLPDDAVNIVDPLVLVEVLSPDSSTRDRAIKRHAYFRLPSVQHYLIVWPDQQRIVCHSRLVNDQLATEVHVAGAIHLDPPGITVTVEEFYAD
jgi:Uma2 family endonuclease